MADFDGLSDRDAEAGTSPGAAPIIDELCQLIDAARQTAAAELAYQSARARLMAKAAAWIAGCGALAIALLFFVLMALVLGLLLGLTPVLGPWGAMGAVVGGLLLVTLLAALIGLRSWRRLLALLRDGKDRA